MRFFAWGGVLTTLYLLNIFWYLYKKIFNIHVEAEVFFGRVFMV